MSAMIFNRGNEVKQSEEIAPDKRSFRLSSTLLVFVVGF